MEDTIQKLRGIYDFLCLNATPNHLQNVVSIHISHFYEVLGRIDALVHSTEKLVHNQAISDAIYAEDDEIEPDGPYDDMEELYPDMENIR